MNSCFLNTNSQGEVDIATRLHTSNHKQGDIYNAIYNFLDKHKSLILHKICEFGYCSEITITQV